MLEAKCIRVVDGDTLEVEATLRVRLDFIDAPESRGSEKELGLITKKWVKEQLEGETIHLDIKKLDMYDRFLSVVYKDGININGEMIKKKLAEIYSPKLHNDGKLDV